jgi:hypothetical protein
MIFCQQNSMPVLCERGLREKTAWIVLCGVCPYCILQNRGAHNIHQQDKYLITVREMILSFVINLPKHNKPTRVVHGYLISLFLSLLVILVTIQNVRLVINVITNKYHRIYITVQIIWWNTAYLATPRLCR